MSNDTRHPPTTDGFEPSPPRQPALAHPGTRFQAQFIDALASLLLLALGIGVKNSLDLQGTPVTVAILALPVLYFLLADALPHGQSLGKRLLKISVRHQRSGKSCTVMQSLLRNSVTPILGWIDSVLIFGESRRRIGDYLAGTIVIQVNR